MTNHPHTTRRRERPVKRINPSGKTVWKARYTNARGRRVSAGTYKLEREAQAAIDAAYARRERSIPDTAGAYLQTWLKAHPRSPRTDQTNHGRIRAVLDVELEGVPLRDWLLRDLRRRHASELVGHMLTVQQRSASGAKNVLRSLSAMVEDAIGDELCDVNPFKGVRVRSSDPRAIKQPRPVRVFTFEQMHQVAAAAGRYEAMIRTLSDCGLRIGELFALRRVDLTGDLLSVSGTAWEGVITGSSREKQHDRVLPVPPGLQVLLRAMPTRIDSELLFPTATGKLWRYNNWRRDVWIPAVKASGVDVRPHEFRHSYISLIAADGIDEADLSAITGHSVGTMVGVYRHPLQRSFDRVREVVG